MFGADFRALFQLATWEELATVDGVAIYNRKRSKGECFATGLGVPVVYDDPEEVLRREQPDFIEAVT